MTQWLKDIQAELKGVKASDVNAVAPEDEGCSHDHEVGIVPPDLQKLFYLARKHEKESREAAAALLLLNGEKREAKLAEAAMHDAESDVYKHIFSTSLRKAFPILWTKGNVGLRTGWKIVWCEHGHMSIGILGAILGAQGLGAMMPGSDDEPHAEHGGNPHTKH